MNKSMNIFLKNWLLIVMLFSCSFLSAQTGIGTTTPNASAKLDVYSTNKGFLPPRVTLTSATDATTIASPAEGLLVYNLGSVGLQAGYYYWNGVSWATIATATSAGNGVTASNMVNLYAKQYSAAAGDIADANGYSFTVPVSGRYLFDFSSTLYAGSTYFTMNFYVRQGATTLGSDTHTSYNGGTHSEYNGKVEVNLQAGVTYNVYVSSNGYRNVYDYDHVYMKMVAGNLPVTGQTVEYGIARYSGADGGSIGDNTIVAFDATSAGNLTWSGNKFSLKANKTYELESSLSIYLSNAPAGVAGRFQIYDYTNNVALANGLFMSQNGSGSSSQNANTPMKCIVTPATDIQVGIRLLDHYGVNGPGLIGSTSVTGTNSAANASYFIVKQIGSSAIVNPWTLAGTNTYNTTGNVGIGTASPSASALLDLTSNSQGLLPPRVALTAKSGTSSPITSPTTGLIVYNTASAGTGGDAVTPGYYYYNGTIWTRMDPEGWSTGVPITIGAITTAPTKGTTTTASGGMDYVRYRNIGGKEYEVEYNILFTSGGTAGSGDYLFTLPGGLQFDFTAPGQIAYTGVSGYNAMKYRLSSAFGDLIVSGFHSSSEAIPYNATQFRIMNNNWGNNTWLMHGPSNYAMSDGTFGMKMTFKFKAL